MRSIRALIRTLLELSRSWFDVDRIRTSPFEGRLVSLQTGQRILLREHIFVVSGPPVANPANIREVTFQLESDAGPASLTIQRTIDGSTCSTRLLDHHGHLHDIFDDDVDLLPAEHKTFQPDVRQDVTGPDSSAESCQAPALPSRDDDRFVPGGLVVTRVS